MKALYKLVIVLVLFTLSLSVLGTNAGTCKPGGNLCCPSPELLKACQDVGGFFDYGLCKCIF
jgi:hypothetical protein